MFVTLIFSQLFWIAAFSILGALHSREAPAHLIAIIAAVVGYSSFVPTASFLLIYLTPPTRGCEGC